VLLKVKNIDVNCRDEQGCTPLHLAAKKGANLAIEKLMSHPECDLYVIDKKKWSALHYATFS
jgi:ankyrin repeat protein